MAEINFGKGIKLAGGFDVAAQLPLDNRTVLQSFSDLSTVPVNRLYAGLTIYCINEGNLYVLHKLGKDVEEVNEETGETTVVYKEAKFGNECTWAQLGEAGEAVLPTINTGNNAISITQDASTKETTITANLAEDDELKDMFQVTEGE